MDDVTFWGFMVQGVLVVAGFAVMMCEKGHNL